MFYLVCFDIVDDKMRRRAVKILLEYGVRVQKSVFECAHLTDKRFAKMKTRLDAEIDHGLDSFRFYPLCGACVQKVEFSGIGEEPEHRNFKVV